MSNYVKSCSLLDAAPVAVITTIQPPTPSVRQLAARLTDCRGTLIVIGDKKGPAEYELENTVFYSLHQQLKESFALAKLLPVGHYARKNIGYLLAIRRHASCIYETDDDNAPASNWMVRSSVIPAARFVPPAVGRWVNAYQYFTCDHIWPRGFPLDEIRLRPPLTEQLVAANVPVHQGLVDQAPDVDAIWRLVFGHNFNFEPGEPVVLQRGNWCPFNTQNTWWWPEAYPLLYVPSYCSFRMCDIWKSFVAQRCLWAIGKGVAFHAADAIQDRNTHALVRDFADEIPGYINNKRIADILDATELTSNPENMGGNLLCCYHALINGGIFPAKELDLVEAWVSDLCAAKQ